MRVDGKVLALSFSGNGTMSLQRMKALGVFWAGAAAAALGLSACHSEVEKDTPRRQQDGAQPATNQVSAQAATNQYHGVAVVDPYRWLENGADPAVRHWTAAQNGQARAYLDGLTNRSWIEDRLGRLLGDTSPDYSAPAWRRGILFLLKFQPPAQQPVLVTLSSYTNLASERVLLDPNRLQTNGAVAIDWFVPSLDGKWVAVSLSENGSEDGTLHVYSSSTGNAQADVIPRVHGPTAGGSVAWNSEGTGFWYTHYPGPGERPDSDLRFYQQVYFHRLGAPPEQDACELGKDFPRIAEIELKSSPDGKRILASVANGDGGEFAHYLREPSGDWRSIARFEDKIKQVEFGRDPLYIEWGADPALYSAFHRIRSQRKDPSPAVRRLDPDERFGRSGGRQTNPRQVQAGGQRSRPYL